MLGRNQGSKNPAYKHGMIDSTEYESWRGLKGRCLNPKNKKWARYGGRGITVCERWMVFENFFADMGKKPSPRHSVDRINNDGNYEPSNCRWATPLEQRHNNSRWTWVTIKGERLKVADWARKIGVAESCLRRRLAKGWPDDLLLVKDARKTQWERRTDKPYNRWLKSPPSSS